VREGSEELVRARSSLVGHAQTFRSFGFKAADWVRWAIDEHYEEARVVGPVGLARIAAAVWSEPAR